MLNKKKNTTAYRIPFTVQKTVSGILFYFLYDSLTFVSRKAMNDKGIAMIDLWRKTKMVTCNTFIFSLLQVANAKGTEYLSQIAGTTQSSVDQRSYVRGRKL